MAIEVKSTKGLVKKAGIKCLIVGGSGSGLV